MLRSVLANTARLLGGNLAAAALGVAAGLLAARRLGGEGFGVLALVQSAVLLVTGLLRFNAAPVLVRRLAGPVAHGDAGTTTALVAFFALLDFGVAALAASAVILLAAPLAFLLGWPEDRIRLLAAYAPAAFFVQTATPLAVLRVCDRFTLAGLHRLVMPATRLGGLLILPAHSGLGAVLAVWFLAHFADSVAAWGLALAELKRRALLARPCRTRLGALVERTLLVEIVSLNLAGSLALVGNRASVLVVGALAGAQAAGHYQLAVQLAGALGRGGELLRRALEPALGRLAAARDRHGLHRLAGRTFAVATLLPAVPVAAAFAAAPWLLALAGTGFADAAPLLRLLLVWQWLQLGSTVLAAVYVAEGRSMSVLRVTALARGLHLASLVPAILVLGPSGAGVAAVLAGIAELALLLRGLPIPVRAVGRSGA